MQVLILFLTVASIGSMIYEIIKAENRSERYLKSLTILCIVVLAVISYFSQQNADASNKKTIALQDERYRQLLGGDNIPTLEITALTKQETALNTNPGYYNPDSLEYFVEVDVKLWNESLHYYLKNVECSISYPNDYLNWKLRKTKNKTFTLDQFQDYYNTEGTNTINLGILPPNVHKHINRFYLPTIDKEYTVTIDVIWANGYYRGTFILTRVTNKNIDTPSGFKTDFVLKLKEPVNYIVTDSLKKSPMYHYTAGFVPPSPEETKVVIKKK